ncbi:GNAT family N-acetyltransferase [Sulfitobacter sp. HNIBRBA2951]|uniref:GNAT family N-acetyltransferase n=1 Tax=Sulfitobacter aquimarinus TaxID=3158557 RepID=UPI0032DF2F36
MQIRKAVPDDVSAVAQIWHLGWHLAHAGLVDADLVALRTPAEFLERSRMHLAKTSVIEVASSVAGFCMVDGNEVYQFYVSPDYHGCGVAAALMKGAEAAVAGPVAWLGCAQGNERAAAFYRKAGWVNVRSCAAQVETLSGPRSVQEWIFEKAL